MGKYFVFLWINLIKKRTVWVSTVVYWLFYLLILIFVPLTLNLSPFFIWGNSLFELQSYSIIIMALICAAATVVIFRDPKDDGTELIIFSKPINRLKLIITKFLVLITAGIIIIVVTTAIFSCTALLPKYIKGDAPHNMWNYALGGLVTFLFFGAVAVIISVASGKIGIMCMTIGVSIVMNITHIALPIIAKTQNDWLKEKYGVNFVSDTVSNASGTGMGEIKNTVTTDLIDQTSDMSTLDYIERSQKSVPNTWVTGVDIGGQINKTYIPEDESKQWSEYGSATNISYKVTNDKKSLYDIVTKPALNSALSPAIYDQEIVPTAVPMLTYQEGLTKVSYKTYGMVNLEAPVPYELLKTIGISNSSVAAINTGNLIGGWDFVSNKIANTYNDYDAVSYVVDKYLWYGDTFRKLWSSVNDTYSMPWDYQSYSLGNPNEFGWALVEGQTNFTPIFFGLDPILNKDKGFSYGRLIKAMLSMLLSDDKYSNNINVLGADTWAKYPVMPSNPYGSWRPFLEDPSKEGSDDKLAESVTFKESAETSAIDAQRVPDFDKIDALNSQKIKSGNLDELIYPEITGVTATTPTHKGFGKELNADYLIKALGPYTSNSKIVQTNEAALKLLRIIISRVTKCFWNPAKYYLTHLDSDAKNLTLESNLTQWGGQPASSAIKYWQASTDPNSKEPAFLDGDHDSLGIRDLLNGNNNNYVQKISRTISNIDDITMLRSSNQRYDVLGSTINVANTFGPPPYDIDHYDPDTLELIDAINDRIKDQKHYASWWWGHHTTDLTDDGIRGIQETYMYSFQNQLSNKDASIIWGIISFGIFGIVIVLYMRTDFK